jgi:hypothetical protein
MNSGLPKTSSQDVSEVDSESIRRSQLMRAAPTSLANDFIRYVLGFSVSVAVGLAPYLGKLQIPLFDSLLNLIPSSVQDTVLPLSAALMGLIAVVIQWYGLHNLKLSWLNTWFRRTIALAGVTFLTLFVIHTLVVVRVEILGGEDSERFLVGFVRPDRPPCPADISDAACIKKLTLDPAEVESFWGSKQIRIATLALVLPYLGFTSSFGMLIGLVLLRKKFDELRRDTETDITP